MPEDEVGDKFSNEHNNKADDPGQKQNVKYVRRDINYKGWHRRILNQNMCLPEHEHGKYPHGGAGTGAEVPAENGKQENEQKKIHADYDHHIQGQGQKPFHAICAVHCAEHDQNNQQKQWEKGRIKPDHGFFCPRLIATEDRLRHRLTVLPSP